MSAAGVRFSTTPDQGVRPGSIPRAALQSLKVRPIPTWVAKALLVPNHYLHSLPAATQLAFGVFIGHRLLGAMTLGVGSFNSHSLVERANPGDCLTLTRLWLSDELPGNGASRILGIVLRSLRRHTTLKFVLSYADPSQGHHGGIYMASGWVYTGFSQPTPGYDLGDGKIHHSRSLGQTYGSRSVRHFRKHGVPIALVPQLPKHRYIYFLDSGWRPRLKGSELPYPKRNIPDGSH